MAVNFGCETHDIAGDAGRSGRDALCAIPYAGALEVPVVMCCVLRFMLEACRGWALFAGGVGGARDDVLCATL